MHILDKKIYCIGHIMLEQALESAKIEVFDFSWDEHLQRSLSSDASATSSSSPDSIVPPSSPLRTIALETDDLEESKKTKASSLSHRPNSYSHWSQTNTATSSSQEASSSAPSSQTPHVPGQKP